jgi:hypothetical protein
MSRPIHIVVPDDYYDNAFESPAMRRATVAIARMKTALTPGVEDALEQAAAALGVDPDTLRRNVNHVGRPDTNTAWAVARDMAGLPDADLHTAINGFANVLADTLTAIPPKHIPAALRGFALDAFLTGYRLRQEQEADR